MMIQMIQLVQVSEYESDNESEAGTIKVVDDMIAPPTRYTRSSRLISCNTNLMTMYLD